MGLFDFFKKKQKFVDELFGELGYTTFKDKSKNFYDGTVYFDSKECGILLEADDNGPTQNQRDFFKDLCDKYPSLKMDVIVPFLNKELEDWNNYNPIFNFDEEFELDGVSIPVIESRPVNWTLTLFSTKIKHYVTIEFNEWQPITGVAIDG